MMRQWELELMDNLRILIAGNHKNNKELDVLAAAGYEIESVDSIDEAVLKLANGNYAKIVLDPSAFLQAQAVSKNKHINDSSQLLRAVIDNAPVGIAVIDGSSLRAKWANPTYYKFLDEPYCKTDISGLHISEFIPEAKASGLIDIFKRVAATGLSYTDPEYAHTGFDRGITYWHYSLIPLPITKNGSPDIMILASEITEHVLARKWVEELASESKKTYAQLQDIIDNTSAFIYLKDKNGRFLTVNQAFADFSNLSKERMIGCTSYDIMPAEIAEQHIINDRKVIDTCKPIRTEEIVPTNDGIRTMISLKFPLRDSKGEVYGVGCVSTDVTDHKQTLEALQQQKELFSAVVDNTKAHLAYLDRDFNFIWVNPTYAKACGKTQEEFIGHNYFEFYPNEENQAIFERVRDTGIPFEIEEKPFVYPDRQELGVTYWDWTLTPIKDNEEVVQSLVFSLMDVTHDVLARQEIERLRTEQEQRVSEIESIISNMTDGVILFDSEGKAVFINGAGRNILGTSHIETLDDWINCYQRYGMDGKPVHKDQISVVRALRGEVVKDLRMRVVTPERDDLFLSFSASPVYDSSGRIIGATTVFRDQSERVMLEQELQQLYDREHRIAEILQSALIPDTEYDIPGCEIVVRYEPALKEAEVGGDFYDVFALDENKIGIVIGDVAGKGLLAAIRVAEARHVIRCYAYLDPRPSRVLTLANDTLCKNQTQGISMLTAFFAILDIKNGEIIYANGGHESPVIARSDGIVEDIEIQGRALGVIEGYDYKEDSRKLNPGDKIVMVTDGISEARPGGQDFFGPEGIRNYVLTNCNSAMCVIADGLLEAAKKHAGGPLRDDAAIVAFTLTGDRLKCE